MTSEPRKIIRRSEPGEWDKLPFGTLCYVHLPNDNYDVYSQHSHDEEEPIWMLIDENTNCEAEEDV